MRQKVSTGDRAGEIAYVHLGHSPSLLVSQPVRIVPAGDALWSRIDPIRKRVPSLYSVRGWKYITGSQAVRNPLAQKSRAHVLYGAVRYKLSRFSIRPKGARLCR